MKGNLKKRKNKNEHRKKHELVKVALMEGQKEKQEEEKFK